MSCRAFALRYARAAMRLMAAARNRVPRLLPTWHLDEPDRGCGSPPGGARPRSSPLFPWEDQSRAPPLRRVVKPLPIGTRQHANKPRKVHNGQIGSGIVASASARSEWMAVLDAGENGCESEHFEGRRRLQPRESICRSNGDYSASRWR